MNKTPLRLAKSAEDYRTLGISPGAVTARENRMHVDGSVGTCEGWFVKAEAAGCTAIIAFMTVPIFMAELGFQPVGSAIVTLPNGTVINKTVTFAADEFESLSDDDCNIRAASSYLKGNGLHSYRAHFEDGGFSVDIDLTPTVPPWRAEAGHVIFGEDDENLLGWMIAVPWAQSRVIVSGEGVNIEGTGTGYMDRAWMNKPLGEFLHDWNWYYWRFNDYSVAAIYMTFGADYGYIELPFFMVYRDGELLAGGPGTQNAEHITYTVGRSQMDAVTGKPVPADFTYEYQDGVTRMVLSVQNATITERQRFADALPLTEAEKQHTSIYNAALIRCTGPAVFTHYENDEVVDSVRVETGPFSELLHMAKVQNT